MIDAIAQNIKMVGESSPLQHRGGIAAHKHGLAVNESVVIIKIKEMGLTGNRPLINSHLTVIFANIFKVVKFKGPDGDGIEVDHADFTLDV